MSSPVSAEPDTPVVRRRGWRALSRRVRTMIVGAVIFIVLFVLALTMPVPYVALTPGPTYNTLGKDDSGDTIIKITGVPVQRSSGHLNMTTVDVSTEAITAFDALEGWLRHDEVIVPRASIYPPGQSEKQTNQQNSQEFSQSQDSAIVAASCELGYPKSFGVASVVSTGAAYGKLQPSDLIKTLDGKAAASPDALTSGLAKIAPGTTVPIGIVREGKAMTVPVKLGQPLQGRTGGSLGITVSDSVCQAPFHVDLGLGNQIGGPSAGMMFALGIIDEVGPNDLTHGRFVAGTGTIDPSGQVGPIGGIQLKMIAARDKGATIFLAPASNCNDVRGAIPSGLQVIKVSTLHQAVQVLQNSAAGKPVPHC